ncbi:unnamed protein product, partial [Adineta steineri]
MKSSSVELPESTRSNSDNDESQSTSSRNEITAAALLQQIKDIVNANNDVEDNTNHTSPPFQRTVNWTFENMKMLICSDLPVFGDEQDP